MNTAIKRIAVWCVWFPLASCVLKNPDPIRTAIKPFDWENGITIPPPIAAHYRSKKLNLLYIADPNLAGIRVDHSTPHDIPRKSWMHPSGIHYYFWDGKVRLVAYNENGKVRNESERWYTAAYWDDVDFSYGSDPLFKTHKDPRKKELLR